MKSPWFAVPLCAVLVAGCEYSRNPSPVRPMLEQQTGSETAPAPAPVFPGTGPDLIAYVAEHYPERLTGGVSLDERMENMRFLRDRMIEAGICGGMSLGWNMKRGGPDKSNDFLAWRRGDGDMGVDIAFDYDNTSQPLRLQWAEAGFDGTYYAEYPAPECR